MNKEQIINEIVKLFENDYVDIVQINTENESEDLYNFTNSSIENTLTGFSTISIRLLNNKQHEKFLKKIQSKNTL